MNTPGGSYWDQHSQNRPDDQPNPPEPGGAYTGPPPMQPPGGQPPQPPMPPMAPQVPPYAGAHTEPYAGGPNAGMPGGYPGGYSPYPGGAGWGGPAQPMPSKHIGWAVVALLFFWPLAIPAFIYSARVQPAWMSGNHAAALDASRKAKMFGIIALVVGIVLGIIYVAVGVPANSSHTY